MSIPNTVVIPALTFALAGVLAVAAAAASRTGPGTIGAAAVAVICALVTFGLFRRSRGAHIAAYTVCGLALIPGLAYGVVGGLIVIAIAVSLSTPTAKQWFVIR